MTQPAISIRIAEPCAESWAALTPTGPGRHCAACQKTVVDFTLKTDAEILAYFQQAGGGRTCGRFRVGQLGRPLRPASPVAQPSRWQRWLAGLLLAALAAQSCQTTTGEIPPTASHQLPPSPPSGITTIDSTTVGEIDTLVADSAAVLQEAPSPGELTNCVLGAPEPH
ncbi:MAG: hypothetical protein EOO36_07040 [Cytophagaceae bacterium]|nr:MAG: hypothetical protein EOO36_07040 [Cytophagaceae bacterium]